MEITEVEDIEATKDILTSPVPIVRQSQGNTLDTSIVRSFPNKKKRTSTCQDPIFSDGLNGRETSEIWPHFTKFTSRWGKLRARCNYCPKHYAADSKKNGTSILWNHLEFKCEKSPFKIIDKKQTTLKVIPIKGGVQGSLEKVIFNVNEVKKALAEFVIIDEHPFRVVEGEGFKRLMAVILPNYELPSRITIARLCLKIYQEEKESLKKLIKDQCVCLTSDTWTSIQNLTYMVITAHWIDNDWTLQKKILNFFQTPDHKSETIAKGVEACLLNWGIDNLFTVTLDNAINNDASVRSLRKRIKHWKGVILGNEFLHVRCNAHILNLIVKEGLTEQNDSISRVRSAVKYVKSSPARFTSFKSYVEKVKLDTHGLVSLDVETRWNSTYLMLDSAVKFEHVFSRMFDDDTKYSKYCLELEMIKKGGHPSADNWKNVNVFIKFLEIFYQSTLKFSGTSYATSNYFFHELFNLQNLIVKYSTSDDSILTDMAKKMKVKFDKYWGDFENMNMLLFVAVVLDPRYKMKYVKFHFNNFYGPLEGKERLTMVMDTLSRLYNHFNESVPGISGGNIGDQIGAMSKLDVMDCSGSSNVCQSQWEKYLEGETEVDTKSDLDKYLMDDLVKTKDLNILSWWKDSSERYPIVSRIARAVLAIPVSTVASESAFSTGGRILNSYRSSLSTKTAEALLCTQQWLRSKEFKLDDLLEEFQKIEIVEKEYPGDALSID